MAPENTNIFFVPYRPGTKSGRKATNAPEVISQQKHAAREYHRKAKNARLAKFNASHSRHARSTSAGPDNTAASEASRPLLPRRKTAANDEEYDTSFAIFDAGTGQLDPFNACVPAGVPSYALDILDYGRSNLASGFALCLALYPPVVETTQISLTANPATTKQWKIFSSSDAIASTGTVKTAVLACAMKSRAAFWTIIFAGATHNAYLERQGGNPNRGSTLRLFYKTEAIKELNREIQSLQGPASDELLLAIITLAAHGSGEHLDPPSKEEKLSVLQSRQNFQYYGRMTKDNAHLRAIGHLVYQKGGLPAVKMPGLPNAIALADIFYAFQDMRPPAFPLLAPSSLIMSTWPEHRIPLATSLQTMTSGFDVFRENSNFDSLLQIISNARLITIGFAEHLDNYSSAPTLNRIVWARNFMTHDVLSLPQTLPTDTPSSAADSMNSNMSSPPHALYNLIRLSTMAFTLLVLFPLPRTAGIHHTLTQQMMLALDDCSLLNLWSTHPRLLLWSTILGGILSEASDLRSWFADQARQARSKIPNLAAMERRDKSRIGSRSMSRDRAMAGPGRKREINASWTVVQDICFHFLWFDGPECDGVARAFWEEACCEGVLHRRGSGSPQPPIPAVPSKLATGLVDDSIWAGLMGGL